METAIVFKSSEIALREWWRATQWIMPFFMVRVKGARAPQEIGQP